MTQTSEKPSQPTDSEIFEARIDIICRAQYGAPVSHLKRLSGGASQESWQYICDGRAYVLRRNPRGQNISSNALPKATEAAVLEAAAAAGIAVPRVSYICAPSDEIGEAYVMEFIEGETIARKILRDGEFDAVRPNLARQCGALLARLHQIDVSALPELPYSDAAGELEKYTGFLRQHKQPHPVFELAIKWLSDNLPPEKSRARGPALVHGDFRNGNIMVSPEDGLVALLDWELTHIGDPMEDLGWPCVPSWRFGQHDLPVGGFGQRAEFYDAYRGEGGEVDEASARFWEILGTLKWGIMCAVLMSATFESGADPSAERGSIGRRSSETEIDLLRMLLEQG